MGVVFLMDSFFSILVCEGFVSFTFDWAYTEKLTFSLNYFDLHTITYQWISHNRASDRVRQKMGNSAAISREIMRQERSIMRQIMRFF